MKIRKLLILTLFMLVASTMTLSSCDDDSDGGRCKYCGNYTNWTYKGGGYVCWACDH